MADKNSNKRLGDILLEEGLINKSQLKKALKYKEENRTFLGQALVSLEMVSEDDLVDFLVRQCRIPHLKLDEYEIQPDIASLIPPEICLRHYVLPIDRLGNLLTVAMVDPLDEEALANVREHTRLRVKPILCTWEDFELVSSKLFQGDARGAATAAIAGSHENGDPAVAVEKLIESAVDTEKQETETSRKAPPAKGKPAVQEADAIGEPEALVEGYTFDQMIPGEVNSFTLALAHAVAETPGIEYNPFFLYGGTGTGKTHLVNSIGHEICRNTPEATVWYVPCQTFLTKLDDAAKGGVVAEFAKRYVAGELFIIDDVQFLAGNEKAQDVFLGIFNDRYRMHKQIIVAGDRAPNELSGLREPLISRFSSGIIAHLEPPELEARIELVKSYAERVKVELPPSVVEYLATEVDKDIRRMEGCIRKVAAFSKLVKQEVTLPLAAEILRQLGRRN